MRFACFNGVVGTQKTMATKTRLSAVIFAALGGGAAEDTAYWRLLETQPGASPSTYSDGAGHVLRQVRLPGGVVFSEVWQGKDHYITGSDESRHGPVMCIWTIHATRLGMLEVCPSSDLAPWKAELTSALDKIDDFIVANNLTPISEESLKERRAKLVDRLRAEVAAMTPSEVERACRSGSVEEMLGPLRSMSVEKFRADLEQVLAVRDRPS